MLSTPSDPAPHEPINPYAPPEAPIGEAPAEPVGDLGEAEAIRREYLIHETNVKSLGSLHYLGAAFAFLGVVGMAAAWVGNTRGGPGGTRTFFGFLIAAYAFTGLINAALGAGLRRLRPWARWVESALVALSLLMNVATTLLMTFTTDGSLGPMLLGNLISWTILGYVLYLMLSHKGAMVFSEGYQEVVAQTPHVRYRTGCLAWSILVLFAVGIAVAVVVALRPYPM